jgi:2-amino-4-hydroxy-6-hydroxymethyldihydropteridine diphosphokinase
MQEHRAFIGIGSNIEPRDEYLHRACDSLAKSEWIELVAVSEVRETTPVGPIQNQSTYLNAVLELSTTLRAHELLIVLLEIERSLGRDRADERRWGPRTIDLDMLLFDNDIIDEPGLTVPHPRLTQRRFVLEPLCELAPDMEIPGTNATVMTHLTRLCASEHAK